MLNSEIEAKQRALTMEHGVNEWLGASSKDVAKSLNDFSRSSERLSNDRELAEKYAQKWVGVCSGEVKAAQDDLHSLLKELDSRGVSRSDTVVRFIEREQRTLIL